MGLTACNGMHSRCINDVTLNTSRLGKTPSPSVQIHTTIAERYIQTFTLLPLMCPTNWQTVLSPPESRPNIIPRKRNLHNLLLPTARINRLNYLLQPLNNPLITPLTLLAHESHKIPRNLLLIRITEMFLDPLPQRIDTSADFFAVERGEGMAGDFTGVRGARSDGGWVIGRGGNEGFDGLEEVLLRVSLVSRFSL